MISNTKTAHKNAGQKLTDHYLLNELWSDLDETSQAAVSGGGNSSISSFTFDSYSMRNDERGAGAIAFVSPKNL
ncbi:hypothetical protein [Trichocoleus sp. DQ-U1]|uniref:hypothetical protein n=1 Tax=Trichocoleus sp. DQ-U1 TaxID=2933926 RepID=UPI003299B7B5